jgi:hypothetical protein
MASVEKKWTGGRSVLVVREMAPNVLLLTMSGFADDVSVAQEFGAWFERRTASGLRMHMFWDTTDNLGYKTECREELQRWQEAAAPHIASSTVLVRSKLMEMGLSITNLLLGNLHKTTKDRNKFESLLKNAVEQGQSTATVGAAAPRI